MSNNVTFGNNSILFSKLGLVLITFFSAIIFLSIFKGKELCEKDEPDKNKYLTSALST